MGSKFSKSSKEKEDKKWKDFKISAKLPERLDKYSTLPASFRRRPAQQQEEGDKTGTLPRNLHRNESFSKRFRKSIKSWASQKGLVEVSRAGRNEIEPRSEESTKPSSVILANENDIEKVADVGQLEEELKKSDSSSQQTEVVVEVSSPQKFNDSKDEVKQIEDNSKLEVNTDSSQVEVGDAIVVEPAVQNVGPADMEVTEETPVLELSAENKDEILQTAVEELQTAEIQQEVEKRATELSEEIMNEVETIMTQKQEVEAESVHQKNEDNDSFEIVDDKEVQEIREESAEKPQETNKEEDVDESQEISVNVLEERVDHQNEDVAVQDEKTELLAEVTKVDEKAEPEKGDELGTDDNQEKALNIQEENDEQPDMLSTKVLADEDLTESADSKDNNSEFVSEDEKSVPVEESIDQAETEKSIEADDYEVTKSTLNDDSEHAKINNDDEDIAPNEDIENKNNGQATNEDSKEIEVGKMEDVQVENNETVDTDKVENEPENKIDEKKDNAEEESTEPGCTEPVTEKDEAPEDNSEDCGTIQEEEEEGSNHQRNEDKDELIKSETEEMAAESSNEENIDVEKAVSIEEMANVEEIKVEVNEGEEFKQI